MCSKLHILGNTENARKSEHECMKVWKSRVPTGVAIFKAQNRNLLEFKINSKSRIRRELHSFFCIVFETITSFVKEISWSRKKSSSWLTGQSTNSWVYAMLFVLYKPIKPINNFGGIRNEEIMLISNILFISSYCSFSHFDCLKFWTWTHENLKMNARNLLLIQKTGEYVAVW